MTIHGLASTTNLQVRSRFLAGQVAQWQSAPTLRDLHPLVDKSVVYKFVTILSSEYRSGY